MTGYATWRCGNVRNLLHFYSSPSLRDADALSWHTWYSHFASTAGPQDRSNGCLNPFLHGAQPHQQVMDEGCWGFHSIENEGELGWKNKPGPWLLDIQAIPPPSPLLEPCNRWTMQLHGKLQRSWWKASNMEIWEMQSSWFGITWGANYQPQTPIFHLWNWKEGYKMR